MKRTSLVAAANEITTDLKGLAPDRTWAGGAQRLHSCASRCIYNVGGPRFGPNGGVCRRGSGTRLECSRRSPFVGDAAHFAYEGACFARG